MGIADWWPLWLLFVLAGFAVPEFLAIRNHVRGDTLSERLRAWFHVNTPGGGASWLVMWSALAVTLGWLLGHIAGWWK